MKTMLILIPFFMNLSVWGAEIVPHGKDLVITVHEKTPDKDKRKEDDVPHKPYCSPCDTRLKVAILTAALSSATTIITTTLAIKYHCTA